MHFGANGYLACPFHFLIAHVTLYSSHASPRSHWLDKLYSPAPAQLKSTAHAPDFRPKLSSLHLLSMNHNPIIPRPTNLPASPLDSSRTVRYTPPVDFVRFSPGASAPRGPGPGREVERGRCRMSDSLDPATPSAHSPLAGLPHERWTLPTARYDDARPLKESKPCHRENRTRRNSSSRP
jgi:hypothetical protein